MGIDQCETACNYLLFTILLVYLQNKKKNMQKLDESGFAAEASPSNSANGVSYSETTRPSLGYESKFFLTKY